MAAKSYSAVVMLLPSLIQFAENMMGAKGGKKKLAAVTSLTQNAILTMAASGLVDPEMATNTVALTDTINATVANMKREGKLEEASK